MLKRIIRVFTGKMIKLEDGTEFSSSYYAIELNNGKRIIFNPVTAGSKKLTYLLAEEVYVKSK